MTRLPSSASLAIPTHDGKLLSPSALRNITPILELLRPLAPTTGRALEIASGTGQHAIAFATAMPQITWHPTDIAADRITSINAYAADAGVDNLHPAQQLDAATQDWAAQHAPYDLIYLGNLLHLIPSETVACILNETAKALSPQASFVIYGPFMRAGQLTSEGDNKFHEELQNANPAIGYKDDAWVQHMLTLAGLSDITTQEMPANNLAFIAKRKKI